MKTICNISLSILNVGVWCLTPLSTIFQLYRDGLVQREVNLTKTSKNFKESLILESSPKCANGLF